MEKYYIKRNNRYIPVGFGNCPNIYEGLWLVQCDNGVTSHKNIYSRLGDLPNPSDLNILAKTTMLEETIIDALREAWEYPDGNNKLCSLADAASIVANKLAIAEEKLTARVLRRNMRL